MRDKIISAVFICIFAVFGLGQWLLPDYELSFQERRKLAQMPDVSMNSIIYGTWMAQFDDYISDQFPARAKLRALRNTAELYFFQKLDAGGIYREKGSNASLKELAVCVTAFIQGAEVEESSELPEMLDEVEADIEYAKDNTFIVSDDAALMFSDSEDSDYEITIVSQNVYENNPYWP